MNKGSYKWHPNANYWDYHDAWSQQGNILVRKEENSKIIQVRDHINLTELRLGENDQDMEDGSQGLPSSITSEITHNEFYVDSD